MLRKPFRPYKNWSLPFSADIISRRFCFTIAVIRSFPYVIMFFLIINSTIFWNQRLSFSTFRRHVNWLQSDHTKWSWSGKLNMQTIAGNNVAISVVWIWWQRRGPLARYVKLGVAQAPGMSRTFPRHWGLAIPICITARASRTYRDACRDR